MPFRSGRGSPFMTALEVVGSDVANFKCPRCGAHDRERHLLLYFRSTGLLSAMAGKSILHFAPELQLPRHIAAMAPSRYVQCDLFPQSDKVQRIDIMNMAFETGSFDIVIVSHVLEHVADDRRAVDEIGRVLKVGGFAVLQTPFSSKLHHTWEDPGIVDETARLQAYGQEDHVRLFGRDIFERFERAGLVADIRTHESLLGNVDAKHAGVNHDEPLFLYWKRN